MSNLAEYLNGRFCIGNAAAIAATNRGWFIGNFQEIAPELRTGVMEVKLGLHRAGEKRDRWSANRRVTTLSIVVSGVQRLLVPGQEFILGGTGNSTFHFLQPGVPHKWEILEDATIYTVRVPGIKGDSVELTNEEAYDPSYLRRLLMAES